MLLPCLDVLTAVLRAAALAVALAPYSTPSDGPPARDPRQSVHHEGMASWYGGWFHGRLTASGQRFDQEAMTAAHRTLPFGTRVEVTNLDTGRTALLTVTDRGPYVPGRILDCSRGAAEALGFTDAGLACIRLRVVELPVDAVALD